MNVSVLQETKEGTVQQGMIAVVFENDLKSVRPALMNLKNEYREIVRTSFIAEMTGNFGLDIVVVHGDTTRIRSFEQKMIAKRGVRSVRLTLIPSEGTGT